MSDAARPDVARAPADTGSIKAVPQDPERRRLIREQTARLAAGLPDESPPRREELMALGRPLLARLGMGQQFLGFAMVAIDNAFWRKQFAAVPHDRRFLLLPKCLRSTASCPAPMTERGLECRGCGQCVIGPLKHEAESLGYEVLVAEGTPAVVQTLMAGRCDAVLGVACLDSLDQAFRRVADLGMPHLAVPLLRDGCQDTAVEVQLVQEFLHLRSQEACVQTRGYVRLLRAATRLFETRALHALLESAGL